MSKTKKNKKPTSKQQLKKLEHKIQKLDNQLKRAVADYRNLQKRQQNNQHQVVKFATKSLLDKLLPVLDGLKSAQTHLKDQGLKLVIQQFQQVLTSQGLEPIEAQNKQFDPQTMDCSRLVPGPKDKVVKVLTPGFTIYDQVLRPAKVEVGSGNKKA